MKWWKPRYHGYVALFCGGVGAIGLLNGADVVDFLNIFIGGFNLAEFLILPRN